MIRRSVLVLAALLLLLGFGLASPADAGSYTPPDSVPSEPGGTSTGVDDPGIAGTGASRDVGGTTLPRTGSDTTESLLRIGVVLVACGGLLAFAARRRAAVVTPR